MGNSNRWDICKLRWTINANFQLSCLYLSGLLKTVFYFTASNQSENMSRLFLDILTSLPEELNNGSFSERANVIAVLRLHAEKGR